MQRSTAILLFSRSAIVEAELKTFRQTGEQKGRVNTGLLRQTQRTLDRTKLPVFHIDETRQQGDTFGARITDAVNQVFEKGYSRVIVVGNDCPYILPKHLRNAAQLLEDGKQVIGPDQRGGAWLIGLQREDFDAQAFAAVSWETSAVASELGVLLKNVHTSVRLKDINTWSDLFNSWKWLKSRLGELAVLFQWLPEFPDFTPPTARYGYGTSFSLRGPPALC